MKNDADIKFSIVKPIGIVSEGARGWKKEINLVSWNERDPKIDIRDWDPDHSRMGKGITLTREEAVKISEVLSKYLSETGA